MTFDERALALRRATRSFLIQPGKRTTLHARGIAVAGDPGAVCNVKVQVRYVKLPKPTGHGFVSLGPLQGRRPSRWVETEDPKTKRTVTTLRRAKKKPLTAIAQQPPKKLEVGSSLKGPAKCACFRNRENKSS